MNVTKKTKKRNKCLTPSELGYLLLISSVITGCTQEVKKLPNYQEALDYCNKTPAYCEESEKLNKLVQSGGASGNFASPSSSAGGSNLLSYFIIYHLFFSRNQSVNNGQYANRFSNFNQKDFDDKRNQYQGRGVYSAGYVARMHNSIATGKTSFETADGKVMKSAQYQGSSKSSITGKTVSRGGFGSTGRSHGIGG